MLMRVNTRLSDVDTYISKAKPFAQPVLAFLREAVHRAVPDVQEEMKWSRPFFMYRGVILGNMAAFKEHCSFGLWGEEMAEALRSTGRISGEAMGSFGRITSVGDLPPSAELESYVRHAAKLIANGTRTKSIQRVAKPPRSERPMPEALLTAFRTNKAAAAKFAQLSPSCRREYVDWIAEAKREDTRARRVATAVEWIAEGKSRNWKYEQTA